MSLFDNDIVRDILERAVRAAQSQGGFDEAMAEQIERQVKADWGGTEPYIRHDVENRRLERNEKIMTLWQQGNRDVRQLAVRFGLSCKQVRRIIDR